MRAKLSDIIWHKSEGALLDDDEFGLLRTANDYFVVLLIYYGRQCVEANLVQVHLLVTRVLLKESRECIYNFYLDRVLSH
jgi:hypothetical protein